MDNSTGGKGFIAGFSLKSLGGKLTLFLTAVGIGMILLLSYLIFESAQTRNRSQSIKNLRYPVASKLEELIGDIGYQVNSVKESVHRKDTSALSASLNIRTSSIQPCLEFLTSHKESFSPGVQSYIDSLNSSVKQIEERERSVAAWITTNYLNGSSDSTFQAELPAREVSELQPLATSLEPIQVRVEGYAKTLWTDNDNYLKDDISYINERAMKARIVGISGGLAIVILLVVGGYMLINKLRTTIAGPVNILNKLVKGEISEYVPPTQDELGSIIDAVNKLSGGLQQASAFAQSIGEGNVNFEFQPLSNEDVLGNSLVQMRDRLKSINEADKKRNWGSEGLAMFANIMRRSDDYESLGNLIISELVKYTHSNQGGLFILNSDNEADQHLQLTAAYAFERRKYLTKRIEPGEGLVGQCYLERRTIYLKQVPQNYITITSGLGGANPSSLLVVPLKVNEDIEGIVELASFKEYLPHEIEFVEKVGEIIASTISSARINHRTKSLLEDSQQRSEEMRAQEEEMRQNMEEMQATQEQMQRQADEMRKIRDKLELEQGMFHVLMEFLPDRITYKDTKSRILRVNKAKADRLNIEAEDAIGKTDFDFFAKENAEKSLKEEQELLRSGTPLINAEERLVFNNGDIGWASTSRIPFKNEHKSIVGMFIITRDITNLKNTEASYRDREKIIQLLLEDMPSFRYIIDRNGLIQNVWKAKALKDFDTASLQGFPAKDYLPEVYDMISQQDLTDTDFVCKGVVEINGEKEVFKHYLFRDSAYDKVYIGVALKL